VRVHGRSWSTRHLAGRSAATTQRTDTATDAAVAYRLFVNGDEQQDLRRLLGLLERTNPWEDLTGNPSDAWQVQRGSALAGDDARTDPYQVSRTGQVAKRSIQAPTAWVGPDRGGPGHPGHRMGTVDRDGDLVVVGAGLVACGVVLLMMVRSLSRSARSCLEPAPTSRCRL
jgi:hypothetical protein